MRRGPRVAALLVALTLAGAAPAHAAPRDRDLADLVKWMTGSFSSAAQASRDTSFFDIRLRMARVWKGRADEGAWLYVEQARGDRLDRPYRQRMYRVRARGDGSYESAVFTLPAPERFAGAWRDAKRLDALAPDSLLEREGCAVVLRREGDAFVGGTVGSGCASDLRGAAYATSEVRVDRHGLTTLDRGFDASGRQVWGSSRGPYVFLRR